MRVCATTNPQDSGASELACRITNRVLAIDGLQPALQYQPNEYDTLAFAADIARIVDSELIKGENHGNGQ